MRLRPTNVPLTAKEFDRAECGVCAGCGCACGYITYMRGGEVADLYGHPHDPNGIGSLCTKGITLIQEARNNPMRIREPLLRNEDEFKRISIDEAIEWVKKNIGGRVGFFLDRLSDLRDYALAKGLTDDVYSDSLYLPFRASTLRPQEWREQRVIVSFECEPVFSEVMATRWLVDAFERSSYILSLSTRHETTSAKSTERLLLRPPLIVRFFEELADAVEGSAGELLFKDTVSRIAKAVSVVKESLLLVGETLLRSPWKGNVLEALRRIRRRVKVNYSIVGNVSPLPSKGIEEFRRDLAELDSLVLLGNPALYLSDEELRLLRNKRVMSLSLFPNLTALNSTLVLPVKLFAEREFVGFRNGFGFVFSSPATVPPPQGALSLSDVFDMDADVEGFLKELGLSLEKLEGSEGGEDISLPFIEEWDGELERVEIEDEEFYVVCDNTLVDELGHWNVWTHEMERRQAAHMSESTARKLGVKERINVNGVELEVVLNNNVTDGVVFVPNSFEESQPFDPGVRVGRLMRHPHNRIEPLRLK